MSLGGQTPTPRLSRQREKIFDREFEYRPSPDEQLKLLQLEDAAQYVAPVATKLKLTNLRVLQKTAWAVEEFATYLREVDTAIKIRVLEQVATIAAMRFRARQPLLAKLLVSRLQFGITDALLQRQRSRSGQPRLEPENPFRSDLEALDYNPLPIDSVVLDFLNTGDLDTKSFEASLPDLEALEVGREFRERIEAIAASIWGKFGSLTKDQLLQGFDMGMVRPPIAFYAFDLLRLNGEDLRGLPIEERKAKLAALLKHPPPAIRYSASFTENIDELLTRVRTLSLEGLIGKRTGSKYDSKRSGVWIKIKLYQQGSFVVGGYTLPGGERKHLGALLVGIYQGGKLRFAGRIGTGFTEKLLKLLSVELNKIAVNHCPFDNLPATGRGLDPGLTAAEMKRCVWVKPIVVCEVKFTEWTRDDRLRHPVFLGLRDDKNATEVVREKAN
jgi:hypothetical protein